MECPGGLWENGRCRKAFAFRPVTGDLELALDGAARGKSLPARVTEVLRLSLESIGGEAPTRERVADLCLPDRRFLLRRLQIHLGQSLRWFHSTCAGCAQPFDFHLDLEALPVHPAPEGYPFASVSFDGVEFRFRLPTGADQEAIEGMEDEESAQWELLRRCRVPIGGRATRKDWNRILASGEAGFSRIEAALESVAPDIAPGVLAPCPQCGHANEVSIDPHEVLRTGAGELLQEVHRMAYHYHWSERDILGLPRPRRHQYLRLIDQARGRAA